MRGTETYNGAIPLYKVINTPLKRQSSMESLVTISMSFKATLLNVFALEWVEVPNSSKRSF